MAKYAKPEFTESDLLRLVSTLRDLALVIEHHPDRLRDVQLSQERDIQTWRSQEEFDRASTTYSVAISLWPDDGEVVAANYRHWLTGDTDPVTRSGFSLGGEEE